MNPSPPIPQNHQFDVPTLFPTKETWSHTFSICTTTISDSWIFTMNVIRTTGWVDSLTSVPRSHTAPDDHHVQHPFSKIFIPPRRHFWPPLQCFSWTMHTTLLVILWSTKRSIPFDGCTAGKRPYFAGLGIPRVTGVPWTYKPWSNVIPTTHQ